MSKSKALCLTAISLIAVLQLIAFTECQNLASAQINFDICAGRTDYIICNATLNPQSIMFAEAFYGIKNPTVNFCGRSPGDCGEELTLKHCGYMNSTCVIGANPNKKISKCGNKIANYLNMKYFCVPYSSNSVKTNDVCSTSIDITQSNGFITSPSYPSFTQQNKTCLVKINVPAGKSVNIWAVDVSIGNRAASGACENSYIKLIDTTGTYDLCGVERKTFFETFCSNQIDILYMAADTPLNAGFRGFKLYYEMYNRPSSCPTGTPSLPASTSAVSTTAGAIPGQASLVRDLKICLGEPSVKVSAPSNFIVFVESLTYGLPSSFTCEDFSTSHCLVERPLLCNQQPSCTFSLSTTNLQDCGGKAQYLYAIYRFIPTISTTLFKMCETTTISADNNGWGVIQSRGYPKWEKNSNCTLTITTNDPTKSIRFYVTDIQIQYTQTGNSEKCITDSLKISDGISRETYCGGRSLQTTYSYTTCSNTLTVSYKTGSGSIFTPGSNRGFNAYYELISQPSKCLPSAATSIPSSTVNPNSDVFSYVLSTDKNGVVSACQFPFKYKNTMYSSCINLDQPDYWCSLTFDYDTDKKNGTCNLGFTSNVQFSVCSRARRNFNCPAGYLIYIVSAEYVETTDGSCDYSKKKCSESAFQELNGLSSGKPTYSFYAYPKVLTTSCSNANSNLVHVDYKCIPEKVNTLKTLEFCTYTGGNQGNNVFYDNQGIIQTSNYPNLTSSSDCSLVYSSNNGQKLISVYALFINLETVASSKECSDYYVQVNDETKICGIKNKPMLIHQSCSDTFKIKIKLGSKLYKATPITSSTVCPPPVYTTQTAPTPLNTLTTPIPPYWVQSGIASPTQTANVCIRPTSISCPTNYIIIIRETMFGISGSKDCFYSEGDCVSYENIEGINCAGKSNCQIPYKLKSLPECNYKLSNYIRVKYDCVPDFYTPVSICDQSVFTQSKGAISSPNYPSFPNMGINCEANINVNSNSLIKVYLKDVSLDANCSIESLSLSSPQLVPQTYCSELDSLFAYETCSNSLRLKLVTQSVPGDVPVDKRGVSIYYEEIPKPNNFQCLDLSTTVRTSAPTTPSKTTQSTSTPVRPSYYGFASPLMSRVGCNATKLTCEQDHIIIVEASVYGVHKDNKSKSCSIEPDDCQAQYSIPSTICSGVRDCAINFSPNFYTVAECGKGKASYFEVVYRCVPTKEAGRPLQRAIEVCSNSPAESYSVISGQSAIYQSPNFPIYPSQSVKCKFNITISPDSSLKIYLNTARFLPLSPGANCAKTNDYIKFTDGTDTFLFCNNINNAKYLMESKSNMISIEFSTTAVSSLVAPLYKGFQIYVQSQPKLIMSTLPPIPPVIVKPEKEGFASSVIHSELCSLQRASISCPENYIILIHEELLIETGSNGCFHSQKECTQPTNILQTECSNKQNCSVSFPETEMTRCESKYADFLDFEYQCIPTLPPKNSVPYTICTDKAVMQAPNGIIQSPGYPTYVAQVVSCSITITPPVNTGVKFFFIDLSLSTANLSQDSCNDDYLQINGDKFCGSSLAQLAFVTYDSDPIDIKLKTLKTLSQEQDSLRGLKIYFETYELSSLTTPKPVVSSTTKIPSYIVVVRNSDDSANLFNYSLGFGIPAFIVLVGLVIFVFRQNSNNSHSTNITYVKEQNNLESFANPLAMDLPNSDLSQEAN